MDFDNRLDFSARRYLESQLEQGFPRTAFAMPTISLAYGRHVGLPMSVETVVLCPGEVYFGTFDDRSGWGQ